jgi:hypothetical protein
MGLSGAIRRVASVYGRPSSAQARGVVASGRIPRTVSPLTDCTRYRSTKRIGTGPRGLATEVHGATHARCHGLEGHVDDRGQD